MGSFKQLIERWFANRSPLTDRIRLTNRNIYIVPSRAGWLLVGVLLIMLLTGINYQNSLIFGLCFWVGSVFAIVIWHTWRNLASLEVSIGGEVAGFVGDSVLVPTQFKGLDERLHHSIEAAWRPAEAYSMFDILPNETTAHSILLKGLNRGWNRTPKMEVRTQYPLGILTAWSVIRLTHPVLGYPQPIFGIAPNQKDSDGDDDQDVVQDISSRHSGSDFYSLKPYVEGDSLRKVDWKRYAKTEELVTKEFITPPSSNDCLDFNSFSGLDFETKLSVMSGWVLEWSEQQRVFGMSLPGVDIEPDQGSVHKFDCLRALALYSEGG